jgi:RNA polymerase sigma-70 factor (ECF subfamily)
MCGTSWASVLDACRLGAEWAWRQVYEDLSPAVLRYFRACRAPDPEDLVGETFVRVVQAIGTFEGDEARFRAWVFTIARRQMIDAARSASRRPARPMPPEDLVVRGSVGDAEDDSHRALAQQRVRWVLDRLTPDQRDVLVLRLLGDLTIEQVGEVLGKRPGAVKSLQARGLEELRRQISRGAVTF